MPIAALVIRIGKQRQLEVEKKQAIDKRKLRGVEDANDNGQKKSTGVSR